jgi:amino acid adenylation domain-containing protein
MSLHVETTVPAVLPNSVGTEHDRLIELSRGVCTAYERDASIGDLFAATAARTPNAIALVGDDGARSYAELDLLANRFAQHLLALGVEPGCRVGVALERSIELPEVLLGILKAGAAYVALDLSQPAEHVTGTIRDAGIEFVVCKGPFCYAAPFERTAVIDIVADAARIAGRNSEAPHVDVGAQALAYVAYTSGSTGRPKGVTIVHRGVVRLVRGADYFDVAPNDVFLHFAPLAFDASTFEIWAPLLNGATLAIAPSGPLSLGELGGVLERFGVTTLWLTAPLFRLMVASELSHFAALKQLLTGGDVVSPESAARFLEAFPACRLIDGYGPTENTTFSCCYRIPSPEAIRTGVPIGRPIANSTAYVCDEQMQLVPVGAAGELYVGGDGLSSGYLNLPEVTAERFIADPFSADGDARLYRTGDLARFRADGALEFLGRIDHQVKISGFRIELAHIESTLRAHAAVADAAVSVITLAGEKALFAHVVRATGARLDGREVRSFLCARLPRQMIPAQISFIEQLPTHTSGKLDRVQLEHLATRLAVAPKAAGPAGAADRSARMRAIATCWSDVLGIAEASDPDENFFDAGGDSLRLLRLHDRLKRELRIEIGILDLFEHCTIRKLAEFANSRVA